MSDGRTLALGVALASLGLAAARGAVRGGGSPVRTTLQAPAAEDPLRFRWNDGKKLYWGGFLDTDPFNGRVLAAVSWADLASIEGVTVTGNTWSLKEMGPGVPGLLIFKLLAVKGPLKNLRQQILERWNEANAVFFYLDPITGIFVVPAYPENHRDYRQADLDTAARWLNKNLPVVRRSSIAGSSAKQGSGPTETRNPKPAPSRGSSRADLRARCDLAVSG
jgi:hypothetical protein